VVLLAIGLSFYVSDHDSAARDEAQAAQIVQGCKRTSQRAAFSASANYDVAAARRARGEPAEAEKADALGDAQARTIPPAPGHVLGDPDAVQVHYTEENGKLVVHLTKHAMSLQAAGCEAAYR
jgi:hypothetical protein